MDQLTNKKIREFYIDRNLWVYFGIPGQRATLTDRWLEGERTRCEVITITRSESLLKVERL